MHVEVTVIQRAWLRECLYCIEWVCMSVWIHRDEFNYIASFIYSYSYIVRACIGWILYGSCMLYRNSRLKYYGHREEARSNPEKCVTIIIDGMNQSKTNLPRLTQTPKSVQGLQQLRTHAHIRGTCSYKITSRKAGFCICRHSNLHDDSCAVVSSEGDERQITSNTQPSTWQYLTGKQKQIRVGFLCPSGIQKNFQEGNTVDSRYFGSLKCGHLDIPAIWFGKEC